jgi:hypothetical protein
MKLSQACKNRDKLGKRADRAIHWERGQIADQTTAANNIIGGYEKNDEGIHD